MEILPPTASARRDFCGNLVCTVSYCSTCGDTFPARPLEFYQQIKTASAKEHFIFLVGPPANLSLTWADDVTAEQKEPQQWAETIDRFLAAA